jgi:hypothetical protein
LPFGNEWVIHELLFHICSRPCEVSGVNNPKERSFNTPLFPLLKQSIPNRELPSWTCRLFTSVRVSIGERPLFSAKARGTASSAAENARIAYCSIVGIYEMSWLEMGVTKEQQGTSARTSSAALATAIEQLISAAPPPYTTRLSTTRLRTTQIASCKARFASSTI